jgi:AAA family ATP:ADP antiporter
MNAPADDERTTLERLLRVVTDVRAGEGVLSLTLALNVFLLLTAYYVIKPVREALILGMTSGAEYKSYMSAVIALALLFAVPAYARFVDRLPRLRLVVTVTLFFASSSPSSGIWGSSSSSGSASST